MKIDHLETRAGSIRCKGCGGEFEVPDHILTNAIRLVEWKESIAEKHVCCGPRMVRMPIRVTRPAADFEVDEYFVGAMRREMRA